MEGSEEVKVHCKYLRLAVSTKMLPRACLIGPVLISALPADTPRPRSPSVWQTAGPCHPQSYGFAYPSRVSSSINRAFSLRAAARLARPRRGKALIFPSSTA